jgi:ACS family phthalate transporter-like MFS transporter
LCADDHDRTLIGRKTFPYLLTIAALIGDSMNPTDVHEKALTTPARHSEAGQIYRRIAWRILPFLLVCYFVSFLDRINLSFAKLQFLEDLGFNDAVYGFAVGIYYLSYLLFELPSNLYMQRVGARATLMRIMVLWGIVTVSMFFIRTPTQLYIARFALGAAEAGFFPGVILYLTYWFPAHYRARMLSILTMGSPISGILGGPIAGWIMHDLNGLYGLKGWQLLFVLEGLPAILLGLAVPWVLSEKAQDAKWLSEREKSIVTSELQRKPHKTKVPLTTVLAEILVDPRMYAAIFGYFAITCAVVSFNFWVPTIIKGLQIADIREIGWLSALPYLTGTAGLWFIGRHSDRTNERRWHTSLSLIASAGGLILLGHVSHSLTLTLTTLSLAAIGIYAAIPVFWAIPTTYLSEKAAPAGIAITASIGGLGALSSSGIIGAVKNLTGSLDLAMGAIGLVMIAAGILIHIAFPKSVLARRSLDKTIESSFTEKIPVQST